MTGAVLEARHGRTCCLSQSLHRLTAPWMVKSSGVKGRQALGMQRGAPGPVPVFALECLSQLPHSWP